MNFIFSSIYFPFLISFIFNLISCNICEYLFIFSCGQLKSLRIDKSSISFLIFDNNCVNYSVRKSFLIIVSSNKDFHKNESSLKKNSNFL